MTGSPDPWIALASYAPAYAMLAYCHAGNLNEPLDPFPFLDGC